MININEINEEIEKLEGCDCTTYDVCRKLAILYTVRDHISLKPSPSNMNKSPMMTSPSVM